MKRGVGPAHPDLVHRQAEHLGSDLRHHGAGALADLGGADDDRDLPVGLEPDGGARDRMRPGRQQPTDRPRPGPGLPWSAPAERRGDLLDVADEVGVQGLAARADHLARPQQVAPPDLQRVDAEAAGDLIDLLTPRPLHVHAPKAR